MQPYTSPRCCSRQPVSPAAALLVGLALVLPGCWGGPGYDAATVTGKVTIDNQPVPTGYITFSPVDSGQVVTDETGFAGIATEQFNDGDSLMGACTCTQLVENLHTAGDGRTKSDTVIRSIDIIVHCLGNSDDRYPFPV